MSYLIAEDYTNLRCDVLQQGTATAAAGQSFTFTSPATFQTDISTTSNTITLQSGSSYYLEASLMSTHNATSSVTYVRFSFHDGTSYIGQNCEMTMNPNFSSGTRIGRRVCSALILDSEITGTKTITVKIQALTGSSWDFNASNFPSWTGQPSIRVLQLPS